MIRHLANHGADLFRPKQDGLTILHIAASQNDIHLLDYVIKSQKVKNVDIKSNDGWTPAHSASFLGNFDSLNLLLENGANLADQHNEKMDCVDEIIR